MNNIYTSLTTEFNHGGFRAIISSGQAVVLHKLALTSKDGDWIIRDDPNDLNHILSVLDKHGANYRLGAPLHKDWLQFGWSSHFEFDFDGVRIRTDFVSRPPRLSDEELSNLWVEQAGESVPFVDLRRLIDLKKTAREKDYPIIGELARELSNPLDALLCSRSPTEIIELAGSHPDLLAKAVKKRPLLRNIQKGARALRRALFDEEISLIESDEERLAHYERALSDFKARWPEIRMKTRPLNLIETHRIMVESAEIHLPKNPFTSGNGS